jgi:hypothetical protein
MTVQMLGAPGQVYSVNGNIYHADANGLISAVAAADVVGLFQGGAVPTTLRARLYNFGAVKAASAGLVVASVALSNGTLTIAANPDVPRPVEFVVTPGTLAITAGTLTTVYTDSQGVGVTETFSVTTALSTVKTVTTSHGVSVMSSATLAAVAGGVSPWIQGGTNAQIALPIDVNAAGIAIFASAMDNAAATLATQPVAGDKRIIATATAPNNTHTFTIGAQFYSA